MLRASGSRGNGLLRRNWIVRSSGADNSSVACIRVPPKASRLAQRRMLATQSRASTGVPSCHRRPGRSVRRQSLPSPSIVCPSTICGEARNVMSQP